MAVTLHQLLKTMVERGGSDLHITTNSPPQIRIDGKLTPLDMPPLSAPETKQLAYSVLTDAQKHRFEENLELDISFGIKGLARFRANIFNQRGATAAVYRQIRLGMGYPIALSEAHEQAVVRAPERQAFFELLRRTLLRDRLPAETSAKAIRKRGPIA